MPTMTVHNFSYGLLTPGLAYLMSFVGSFLGLRCTTRARANTGASRIRWLLIGAVSIGATGIWVMHFIAMLGFTIPGETIHYNVPVTLASMLIAVIFVGVGMLMAGRGDYNVRSLLLGGLLTGVGVGAMHYSGMLAMRMPADVDYNPTLFTLSIVIAVVAATAALWATLRLHGLASTLGAAAIMGVAVSGMHYTGMAAMRVYSPPPAPQPIPGGVSAAAFLLPLIVGVSMITFVLTAMIALSPTAEEINADADLMRRIEGLREQPPANPDPVIVRLAQRRDRLTSAPMPLQPLIGGQWPGGTGRRGPERERRLAAAHLPGALGADQAPGSRLAPPEEPRRDLPAEFGRRAACEHGRRARIAQAAQRDPRHVRHRRAALLRRAGRGA